MMGATYSQIGAASPLVCRPAFQYATWEEAPKRVDGVCDWFNGAGAAELAAGLHYKLVMVHPFSRRTFSAGVAVGRPHGQDLLKHLEVYMLQCILQASLTTSRPSLTVNEPFHTLIQEQDISILRTQAPDNLFTPHPPTPPPALPPPLYNLPPHRGGPRRGEALPPLPPLAPLPYRPSPLHYLWPHRGGPSTVWAAVGPPAPH